MTLEKAQNNCPVQFDCSFDETMLSYECTVTFNPTVYTRGSAYYEGVPLFERELIKWLKPFNIEGVWIVVEYTKAHFPHCHACIQTSDRINPEIRNGIVKGLQRMFGRSTFKQVADINSYEEYMQKDLLVNYEKSGSTHYCYYYKSN